MKGYSFEEIDNKYNEFFEMSDDYFEQIHGSMSDAQPGLYYYALQMDEFDSFPPGSDDAFPVTPLEKNFAADTGVFIILTLLPEYADFEEIAIDFILEQHDKNVDVIQNFNESVPQIGEEKAVEALLKNYKQKELFTYLLDNILFAAEEQVIKPEIQTILLIIFKTVIDSIEKSMTSN